MPAVQTEWIQAWEQYVVSRENYAPLQNNSILACPALRKHPSSSTDLTGAS